MTRLIIARHGNTFGPEETPLRVGARTDLDLVASGIEQAFQLGTVLKKKNLQPTRIIAGPLKRTLNMAEIAARMLADPPVTVEVDERLREVDYGPDEGQPEDKVIARIGTDAIQNWDQHAIVPDGWQTDPEKSKQDWQDLADTLRRENPGENILIVTSNGIARFAPYLTGDFEGFKEKFPLKLSTGAFGILEHHEGRWQVLGWNVKPKDHLSAA
ncbi:MAG: histidine phosphatase family protein [Pseudomonadota bacterium]